MEVTNNYLYNNSTTGYNRFGTNWRRPSGMKGAEYYVIVTNNYKDGHIKYTYKDIF